MSAKETSQRSPAQYTFQCFGHENIRAKHHKTIEFTKDSDLTRQGTCILGVRADFDASCLKSLSGKIRITVEVGDLTDKFYATINPDFDDDHEIVFRRSTYRSKRTLGLRLNKGADCLKREIVQLMKDPDQVMKVTFEELK